AEEIEKYLEQIGRPGRHDLRIAAHDDGIGVVPRVAPAPDHRLAHDHEGCDVVDDVIHPARLEGGAVAAFVPAAVTRRAVQHAVAEEERHAPPGAPEIEPA